jgi:hypothetical protein
LAGFFRGFRCFGFGALTMTLTSSLNFSNSDLIFATMTNLLTQSFPKFQLFIDCLFGQLIVGDPLAINRTHNQRHSLGIGQNTVIEAECFLVKVSGKVFTIATYIRSPQSTLEQAPIVLAFIYLTHMLILVVPLVASLAFSSVSLRRWAALL